MDNHQELVGLVQALCSGGINHKNVAESHTKIVYTVFDLISGLSAYVILGPKNRPLFIFFIFFFIAFKYFVCVFPGCKTLLPKIVACEGPHIMMTGSLKKKDLIFFFNFFFKLKKGGGFAN